MYCALVEAKTLIFETYAISLLIWRLYSKCNISNHFLLLLDRMIDSSTHLSSIAVMESSPTLEVYPALLPERPVSENGLVVEAVPPKSHALEQAHADFLERPVSENALMVEAVPAKSFVLEEYHAVLSHPLSNPCPPAKSGEFHYEQ